MINLLPKEEKKKLILGFYLRFATVIFIAIGLSVVVLDVLIIPSYIISLTEKKSIIQKLAIQKDTPAPINEEGNSKIIKELNNKINLIDDLAKNKFIVSEKIINEIVLDKMPDIKLLSINYSSSDSSKRVIVNGIAPSRERLLLFRRALEDNTSFKKVDLPISNFIKGSNIQFTMELIPS